MEKRTRIDYYDIARGIGIILVIMGHIEYISESVRIYIVSFHMPLFFVISGMLMKINKAEEKDFAKSIKGKLKHIMLPYLCFSILDIIIYYIYFLLTGRDGGIPTIIKDLTETVTLYGISVLWFLPALFLAEITFLAILKTAKKIAPIIALAVLITAIYLNTGLAALNAVHGNETWFFVLHLFLFAIVRSLICMGFVVLGYYAAYIWQKIPGVSPTETGKYTVPADILIGINLLVTVFFLSRANGGVDLHYGVFGNNTFVYFLTALTGSFGIIFLCKATEGLKNKGPLRIFQYYGENSLVVMATHMDFYILYVSEVLAFHFIKYVNHAKSYIFNFMIVAFVLIAEIFMIEIINRFFPFILGKTKSKRKA